MVEFNLLPDVKLQFIRARRLKRLVVGISVIVALISLAVFVFLIIAVDVVQKVKIHNLSNTISSSSTHLKDTANLDKILTIQNQLQQLPTLESQTPITSRIFNFFAELTPVKATISTLNIDLTQNTVSVSGGADTLNTVNQFVDALKFTTFNDKGKPNVQAFSTVVLSAFNYTTTNAGSSPAQYTITFNFNPDIFSSSNNISSLNVPSQITTRSVIDQPMDLFKASTTN